MALQPQLPTTQRAYTLRLRGIDPMDSSWRDALWATHEAVNKGAKVFGDWLLTLRGGLDHALADAKVKDGKEKPDRDPTSEERRDRRILLALSWLSVESAPRKGDVHEKYVVASGKDDTQSSRDKKVVGKLREILGKRGVKGHDLDGWIVDCEPSLSAAIRADAVWVNRSEAFDAAQGHVGQSLTREEVWDLLEPFFGSQEAYLAPLQAAEDSDAEVSAEDKAKDLVQKAGQWLSSRFGTGKGAKFDCMAQVYQAIAIWGKQQKAKSFSTGSVALESLAKSLAEFQPKTNDADGILALISGPGYKSATRNIITTWKTKSGHVTAQDVDQIREKAEADVQKCNSNIGGKGHRPWSDAILGDVEAACGFKYLQKDGPARHSEFAVMLDHAARRVSISHSWIKRAESERQKFKEDAAKIDKVPPDARKWLDQFCEQRSGLSGAIDAYRIRKRAAGGWKEVVAEWSRATCKTVEDRIAVAREAQADPDIDKFGDIQLFEALAEDDAVCVWQTNGTATTQPLIDYAAAMDAEAKQRRFKVPAYRHPDPLSHPVFCDFGNSRWEIRFAVHDAVSKLANARDSLARHEGDVTKVKKKLDRATKPEKQAKAKEDLKEAEQKLGEAKAEAEWLSSQHALSMGLWDGVKVGDGLQLFWSCKRLTNDMALRQNGHQAGSIDVTRADRLGRAAVGATSDAIIGILGVFDEEHWNGRLQAPRTHLNAIAAHVAKHGWDAKAGKMRDRLRWLVSFSPRLTPAGPFIEFAKAQGIAIKTSRKNEWYPQVPENEGRERLGKLILPRVPELRVLSVDLGHRFAAACSVWETLSPAAFEKETAGLKVRAGASDGSDLYLHVEKPGKDGKLRIVVYRRIGSDSIPGGGRHPAPWARLDRQFLIKLQGEDRPVRAALNKGDANEVRLVAEFSKRIGLRFDDDRDKDRAVDALMARTVRIAALGLKRHARRAKIAYAMDPNTKSVFGMGGKETAFNTGDETHVRLVTDALFDWHALAIESKWDDITARELWNAHIAASDSTWKIEPPKTDSGVADERTRQQRRKDDNALRERLKPLAEKLIKIDRKNIHQAWRDRWDRDDGLQRNKSDFEHHVTMDGKDRRQSTTSAKRDASGWHAELRWLTDWIMGWHLPGAASGIWNRNVGGLSITRIATMKSLYQLHKAFAMRARPEKPQGAPEKGETNAGVAQSILDAMERMREQRVKQLASRIAEAALGIGRIKIPKKGKTPKRPRERVDQPCHAVVIENLTHYRPDELQTRRENRQLMSWSSSKVKKYLTEACQLHGLHLREVQAGYTSRQDSRTGAPGVRCADVPLDDFLTKPWWRRQVNIAKKKTSEDKGDARERHLVDLDVKWSAASEADRKAAPPLRIPVNGGELFVSADSRSPAAKGLQADLNAAANIGLKSLLDPDFPAKWWYVPCDPKTFKPIKEKTKGCQAMDADKPLKSPPAPAESKGETKKGNKARTGDREVVNLWRDACTRPLSVGPWCVYQEYKNQVRSRVVNQILRPWNGLKSP